MKSSYGSYLGAFCFFSEPRTKLFSQRKWRRTPRLANSRAWRQTFGFCGQRARCCIASGQVCSKRASPRFSVIQNGAPTCPRCSCGKAMTLTQWRYCLGLRAIAVSRGSMRRLSLRSLPRAQSPWRCDNEPRFGFFISFELKHSRWPVGLMDKASASGAGDSRFESWAGHIIASNEKHGHSF